LIATKSAINNREKESPFNSRDIRAGTASGRIVLVWAVMVLRGYVGKSEADFLRNDSIGPDGTGSTRDLRPDPWPGSPALRVMARGYSPELMKPS